MIRYGEDAGDTRCKNGKAMTGCHAEVVVNVSIS